MCLLVYPCLFGRLLLTVAKKAAQAIPSESAQIEQSEPIDDYQDEPEIETPQLSLATPVTEPRRIRMKVSKEERRKLGKEDIERLQNLFVSASLSGELNIVMRLRCQIPIDCRNTKWGFTALMASAGNGHLDIVNYLTVCGANINLQDKSGWSALMLAARANKFDVVEYLTRVGADTKLRTKFNHTVYALGHKQRVAAAIERGLKFRLDEAKLARKESAFPSASSGLLMKPVLTWSEGDVGAWLDQIALGKYAAQFSENMVNGDLLLDLDEEDLVDLQIMNETDRLRILTATAALRHIT